MPRLRGHIRSDRGDAVSGAAVTAEWTSPAPGDRFVYSAEDGSFDMPDLPASEVRLHASAAGRETRAIRAACDGEPVVLELRKRPLPLTARLTLRDPRLEDRHVDAIVHFPGSVGTLAQGTVRNRCVVLVFHSGAPSAVEGELLVRIGGHAPLRSSWPAHVHEHFLRDVQVARGVTISGRLVGPGGEPVRLGPHPYVCLEEGDSGFYWGLVRAHVERTGEFLLTGVPAEGVRLHARTTIEGSEGFYHACPELDARALDCGRLGDVRLELWPEPFEERQGEEGTGS